MSRSRSSKPLFSPGDHAFLVAVVRMATVNPWGIERIPAEREALGPRFKEVGPVMANLGMPNVNVAAIEERLEPLLNRTQALLAKGAPATVEERLLYQDACRYSLFDRFDLQLEAIFGQSDAPVTFYDDFEKEYNRLLDVAGAPEELLPPELAFAFFFQIRRAYYYLFTFVLGTSLAAARLRAAVWEAIFTFNLRSYQQGLFECVSDVPTLVMGETGTGKELVAQAIGYARFIPFDKGKKCFVARHDEMFRPLNLSALSPSLIESELFGHRRGAFTGAVKDNAGWLEEVGPWGTVFLDEIGELDAKLQVKLLRVVEKRTYQRLGDTKTRRFEGRILSATNRDLVAEIEAGTFREDLYFRLGGLVIRTPSLREQLAEAPGELQRLVRFFAARVSRPQFAAALAEKTEKWIAAELPADYGWPGNVREMEQCVRSIMMCGVYHRPVAKKAPAGPGQMFQRKFEAGEMTLGEVDRRYATLVHAQTGSMRETARRLGIDRRQVPELIDEELLARLGKGG